MKIKTYDMERKDPQTLHLELLKDGHVSALSGIYAKYHRHIHWIGMGLIRDPFVVETLVQDTFLRLWANRERMEEPKHIFNFLRFVMTRECTRFYSRPRNKFLRSMGSLEAFENHEDRMAGHDPLQDAEDLKAQEREQRAFDRIKRVLPLLDPEKRHLIDLCLKYDFCYGAIAKAMGSSVPETFHGVKMAIADIKYIIDQGQLLRSKKRPATVMKVQGGMTEQQARVLKMRCENKHSFASIAKELDLSEKEVHGQFMAAYKILREKHQRSA
ncbi:MAG: sigma factor [Sediminicola sp.]